ncbi:putative signal peptide protein [Puccinia sorghi]|uniref:Putative signal peptide protein n=1 Tax=Puccinia sorghi TaxID=27349 RepID=A0A0L6VJI5_9BASI|nr:putative signal peptide protein [Puccinia sorghi]
MKNHISHFLVLVCFILVVTIKTPYKNSQLTGQQHRVFSSFYKACKIGFQPCFKNADHGQGAGHVPVCMGHGATNQKTQDRFQHSSVTISQFFNHIIHPLFSWCF